jgi:hypothetical protein
MKTIYISFTNFLQKEVSGMNAVHNRCVECDDVITNPICPNCLAAQMVVVVGEYNSSLVDYIKGFKIYGETICISCGDNMGLCAHCFSKDVYLFLKDKQENLAKEFLQRFDFELRKEMV